MVVTISEARQQLVARRQQIAAARLPTLTPAQLRARGRAAITAREIQARELEARKIEARAELVPFEEEIARAERQQIQISKQANITRTAFEMIRRKAAGKSISLQNDAVRFEYKRILREDPSLRKAVETGVSLRFQESAFRQAGLTPITIGGKIAGFEDIVTKKYTPIKNIQVMGKRRLDILERAGFIEFSEITTPERILTVGLTVGIAPTFTERFGTAIQEARPELGFIPEGDIKTGIQTILGIGLGTLSFSKAQVQGQLSKLRDVEGKRIFTNPQAKGLTDIGFEIAEGFALGAGAGKAFTLGRGAFLKLLSPTIKNSPTFKKITKVADITLLAGLGTAEAVRLNKIAKTQGTDQAIIEAIGLVSFGAGFTKTGLKADPIAEKEFDKFISTFRDIGAKGRRGELLPKKRRRKKGDVQVLEQLTEEEVERARTIISEVEKRLLKQKDLKGQLKVLAELKKGLKTPEARKNFQEFVLSLIEKNILKVPKVEIIPGVEIIPTFREVPPFKIEAFREVPKGSILNQQRIAKAKLKGEIRTKISDIQREIEKQRNKLLSLVSQKASQKIIQAERLKLKNLQKERLKLSTSLLQASKLKLEQVLKPKLILKLKPRPRPKIRFFVPPPFPGLKLRIKKKLVKVPLEKGGYNVFVKSKGKFKKVNINPLSKKKAHDLGSWLVDRSTARTWKRKQIGFKAQPPILKVPSKYFMKTRIKYRGKKIKGKVQPLKNLGIEKRKFAIDTPREKKQLSAARVRADLLRKIGLKKPRRIPTRLKSTKLIRFKKRK